MSGDQERLTIFRDGGDTDFDYELNNKIFPSVDGKRIDLETLAVFDILLNLQSEVIIPAVLQSQFIKDPQLQKVIKDLAVTTDKTQQALAQVGKQAKRKLCAMAEIKETAGRSEHGHASSSEHSTQSKRRGPGR